MTLILLGNYIRRYLTNDLMYKIIYKSNLKQENILQYYTYKYNIYKVLYIIEYKSYLTKSVCLHSFAKRHYNLTPTSGCIGSWQTQQPDNVAYANLRYMMLLTVTFTY